MKSFLTPITRRISIALVAGILVSCGGGGAKKTLTVDFSYPYNAVPIWRQASIALDATGLEGNTPQCSVVSGGLPNGLSFQPGGCLIVGVPKDVGLSSAMVRLTVPGFEGQVDKLITIVTFGPPLYYDEISDIKNLRLPWAGMSVSIEPRDSSDRVWVPIPGETLLYTVSSGSLPEGLKLNPASGKLTGVLTSRNYSPFTYAISLGANSTYGAFSATSRTLSLNVSPSLRLDYSEFAFFRVGSGGETAAIVHHYAFPAPRPIADYSFSSFRLASSSAPMPRGLNLNEVTGTISGTPLDAGTFSLVILADASVDGQTGTLSTSYNLWVRP